MRTPPRLLESAKESSTAFQPPSETGWFLIAIDTQQIAFTLPKLSLGRVTVVADHPLHKPHRRMSDVQTQNQQDYLALNRLELGRIV